MPAAQHSETAATTATTATTTWPVLDAAHAALRSVTANLAADHLDLPTPCSQWTVAQVVQHATGDQLGYAAFLTGSGGPDEDPFAPSGRLVDTAADLVETALARSAAAWRTVAQDAETVPTPLPQGALPPALAVGYCALDAAVHAWDLARATGQPDPLTPELAAELMVAATALTEPLRPWGAYAEALPEAAGDGPVEALLRYLGRDPHWTVQRAV